MSHIVGNGEKDFDGLENLSKENREEIESVKMLKSELISKLESVNVITLVQLKRVLKEALREVRAEIFFKDVPLPVDDKKETEQKKGKVTFFGQNIKNAIRILKGIGSSAEH